MHGHEDGDEISSQLKNGFQRQLLPRAVLLRHGPQQVGEPGQPLRHLIGQAEQHGAALSASLTNLEEMLDLGCMVWNGAWCGMVQQVTASA